MVTLTPSSLGEHTATSDLFGGNILAPTRTLGEYSKAVDYLGVTGLRWPGGSLTEYTLDLSNPDATLVENSETGQTTEYISISEMMGYAAETGEAVTIVLPTRTQLGTETDAYGNRLPDINEDELRGFVEDVVTGVYGDGKVAGFEIGNEYWGSGQMNAVEYGELSAQMSTIIDDTLNGLAQEGVDVEGVNIYVQMGHNYGYSHLSDDYEGWDSQDVIDDLLAKYPTLDISYDDIRGNGDVNWTTVNNEMVQMAFDTEEEQDAMDGIIAHIYSRGEENENSRYYDLSHIENDWTSDEGFQDLDILVSEWNQKSVESLDRNEDYGLKQAHEMLNLMEGFMDYGVDAAHVWPLIQNTKNALDRGFEFDEPTPAGDMFRLMSETLPGKKLVDFSPNSRETEAEGQHADVHGFYGDNDLVLYIASNSDETTHTDVDVNGLLTGYEGARVRILGVEEGDNPYSSDAAGVIEEEFDLDEAIEDGYINATLDAHEIMVVEFYNITPTEEFNALVAANEDDDDDIIDDDEDDDDDDGGFDFPTIPPEDVDDEDDEETPVDEDDDGGFDIGGVLMAALLPLLLLGAMAGGGF